MKKFAIKITETLEKTVIVEAENTYEALQLCEKKYKDAEDDFILSSSDYSGVEFTPTDLKVVG